MLTITSASRGDSLICQPDNNLVLGVDFKEGSGISVSSGDPNDLVGGRIDAAWEPQGMHGTAMKFTQGSTNTVSFNPHPSLNVQDYTLSFWIKFTDDSDGLHRQVIAKHAPEVNSAPGIWVCPGGLGLYWVHDGVGSNCLGPTGEGSRLQ